MNTESDTLLCLACYKDRLASVCDNADQYKLFEIRDDHIYPAGLLSLPSKDPMDRTSAILARGVSFFVCGGICARQQSMLEHGGVTVLPWLSGSVEEVVDALEGDALHSLVMPGAGRRGDNCRPNGSGRRRKRRRRDRQGRGRMPKPSI